MTVRQAFELRTAKRTCILHFGDETEKQIDNWEGAGLLEILCHLMERGC